MGRNPRVMRWPVSCNRRRGCESTTPGVPAAICADGAAPSAYVLAQNGNLFTLDPSTLSLRALGVPVCAPNASAFTVSEAGRAYVLSDALYQVDLGTLACTRTPYAPSALGSTALATGAGTAADRMWSYGSLPAPTLGVSDLVRFVRFQTGLVTLPPTSASVDLATDTWGQLFALGADGTLMQLDPATGAVLGADLTEFDGASPFVVHTQETFKAMRLGAASRVISWMYACMQNNDTAPW